MLILRRAIWVIIMEHGKFCGPYFEWGAVLATFLSVLSIVPRHCACLTCFIHPKLRKINAVLITQQLITLILRHLWCAGSIPVDQILRANTSRRCVPDVRTWEEVLLTGLSVSFC